MKKFLTLLFFLLFTSQSVFSKTLEGYVQEVPNDFFGNWRVEAKLIETDSSETFKEKTVDLWNIIEEGNVIKLCNPFSGASAKIEVKNSENENLEFSKTGSYGNKMLTDTANITIDGENFWGTDVLQLDTLSELDGSIRKSSNAKYQLKGEKISGQKILKK